MSRRILSTAQSAVLDVLEPAGGLRMLGGCASCDAYQVFAPEQRGVWVVEVHHDADCPELRIRRGCQ
jgi:hypothetical protein